MRVVGILGLMFAVVIGYLAFDRVSSLETSMESIWTSGPMNLLVNHTSFFFFLLVITGVVALIAAAAGWVVHSLN